MLFRSGTSTEAFEDFYFQVCNLDYSRMGRAMKALVELMNRTDKVRLTGKDTDLTFSIKGMPAVKCCGERNIPDGEVYTAPVKNSMNGIISYNTPSEEQGFTFENIVFEVKDGKTIDTYFNGSDTSAVTYNIPTDKTGDFTLGKLMFRHNIKYANGTEELGRYDNIIVKDAAGTVIFKEDFEDPSDTGFDGGEVVDGMFQAGLKQVEGEVNSAIELDSNNIIDVTDQVVLNEDNRTGTLDWTAPDNGDYILMYYWQQGTAQESKPATKPSYCINYFDQEGVNATKEYWMEHVLNDPALNEKIKQGDVQLFMDSLEYTTGKGFANWSDDFAEEFKARKGYDTTPYLILGVGLPQPKGIDWHPEVFGTYNLDDANLGQRILNDFHDVQTELYMENLLIPLRDWLHEFGIKLRVQISYGKYLEISEPSMAVDYPETERYNQANQLDMYRLWSGGAHLENKILSS